MQIDTDGEMPVEMVRALLWEYQDVQFTGDIPTYFQPRHPEDLEDPAGEEQGDQERQTREVYQRLGEAMEEELTEDRRFFIENPSRIHLVRSAFPAEERFLREQAGVLEGPGTIPNGEMIVLVKQIVPGLRLRQPLATADGWKTISVDFFGILDEEHSRYLWRHIAGE